MIGLGLLTSPASPDPAGAAQQISNVVGGNALGTVLGTIPAMLPYLLGLAAVLAVVGWLGVRSRRTMVDGFGSLDTRERLDRAAARARNRPALSDRDHPDWHDHWEIAHDDGSGAS